MNVKDIVKEWLSKNGYDGLSNQECGCGIDDFMPCEGLSIFQDNCDCEPGHKWDGNSCITDDCDYSGDCNEGCYRTTKQNNK